MRPTARGLAVLLVVPVLYLAGEFLGFALLRALAGAALGVLVVAVLSALRPPRVVVHREVYPDRVERGRPAMATLQIRNPGSRRHPGFTARDLLAGAHLGVRVTELAPGAAVTRRYPLPTERRGRFAVGPLTLERSDALGLVRNWQVTGDVAPLWVHPRRHPVRTVKIGWPRHHYDAPGSPEPLAGSTDLRQIREYVPGDEVRHLHWKAMARTGTLMVREYSDPAEPRFTVLIDNRSAGAAPAWFEDALEVAASLAWAALASGDRTRLVTTSGDLDVESTAGLAGARVLLDALCELGTGADTGTVPAISGGVVVLVGGGPALADTPLLTRLRAAQAAVTVVDLAGDAEGGAAAVRAAGMRTVRAGSAADAVRGWNELAGR